jgi:hypothetical protein
MEWTFVISTTRTNAWCRSLGRFSRSATTQSTLESRKRVRPPATAVGQETSRIGAPVARLLQGAARRP